MKIIIGDKGKSHSIEIPKEKEAQLYGTHVGDEFDGGFVGAAGYSFRITGGSDKDGFPMRADVHGTGKLGVLLSDPPGYQPLKKGERMRKIVRGNTISEFISQLNVTVAKTGSTPLDQLFPKAEGGKREEKEEAGKKGK